MPGTSPVGRMSRNGRGRAPLLLVLLLPLALASCTTAPEGSRAAPVEAPKEAYAGAEVCRECHKEVFQALGQTRMGRLFLHHPRDERERMACESCHGPGAEHADTGGKKHVGGLISFTRGDPTPVAQRNAMCQQCHEKANRFFWQGSPHEARDVACTDCHAVKRNETPRHQLARADEIQTCGTCHVQKRAQQMRLSRHPLAEGKMRCSSCHNPHGTVTPALLKESSVNDTCYACHAEKRGPFLWEHAPVVESCTSCHQPHGSNHEAMLTVAKPRLCQQCHIETGHPTRPFGTDAPSRRFVRGQACASCHVNVHGSNHPNGSFFTR